MGDSARSVQDHYGLDGLLQRVLAALAAAGIDPDHPSVEDLQAIDQLHTGGLAATKEHGARAGIAPDMHVLDLGCGVGGSARYLAENVVCRVTGIDLTKEFVDVARQLTARCRLADKVTFEQADALDLPFEGESFDHVWSHNVTMNIADKTGLAAEVARVLRRGGRWTSAEIAKGPAGDPEFPLPWARHPRDSFLVSPDQLCAALEAGGLRVVERIDDTEVYNALAQQAQARDRQGPPQGIGIDVVLGDDLPARARNMTEARAEGKIVHPFVIAEKA